MTSAALQEGDQPHPTHPKHPAAQLRPNRPNPLKNQCRRPKSLIKQQKFRLIPSAETKKISKYYKKSGDEGEEDVNTSGEQPSAPKPAETPKPSVQDAEIPDELSHLRSAWEVAKEYKR